MVHALLLSVLAQAPAAAAEAARATHIEYRIAPLADLWCLVRRDSADPASAPPEFLQPAVVAARALEPPAGQPPPWGLLEAALIRCEDAAALPAAFAKLPETVGEGAAQRPLREPAQRLAEALQAAEASFRKELWPERQKALQAAQEDLQAGLGAHEAECFADVLAAFGMSDPGLALPVYLVGDEPPPGAHTIATRGGTASFVSIGKVQGSLLAEMVLHETIHALDRASSDQPTLLADLRQRLKQSGLAPNAAALRDVPHLLFFAEAAGTIQRRLDPAHKPYGEAFGVYARIGSVSEPVMAAWSAYRKGELGRDEAVSRLVQAAEAANP